MLNSTVPAKAGTALPGRVDGIDVAQLLRDIGEASASTNPVDLFRLCLGAQRVLAQAPALTPAEAALLAAFRAAADGAQVAMAGMAQSIAAGSPRRAPAALTLVAGQHQGGANG